ncbi:hypothetical protein SAMN05428948_2944 [Massilia sp. CF038]|nr:hypothetical protein SAMN05428948_2944 [Massilia sp. CF038]
MCTFDRECEWDQTFLILFANEMAAIMQSESFSTVWQRVQNYLAALGAERRCAMRLDKVADRLAAMGVRINMLRRRMHEGSADEAVDADFLLREALKGLKENIRTIRCQLGGMHVTALSARMQRAFARLHNIAEDTYASADQLQWEIAEHDRRF